MIYRIKLTYIDHVHGTHRETTTKQRYKTHAGARKTADQLAYACRPDGKTLQSECIAVVIPQGGAA